MYRTDMARELFARSGGMPGVTEETEHDGAIEISRIVVENVAAARLGKPAGRYTTIELPEDNRFFEDTEECARSLIARELAALMKNVPGDGGVLVLGLGNRAVTPDALGPRTADKILVTRHIQTHLPEVAPEGMRAVSVLTPGVLGTTGVETAEIVAGVIERTRPAALLCIDALSSERAERISASIQMNDTGIQPGAGVHNARAGITKSSTGIPVFALGVPTVVDALTIAGRTVELLLGETGVPDPAHVLTELTERIADERLSGLIVTPKEIDALIERASRRLADGVNRALLGSAYEAVRALMLT